jgi:superfamily II DNA or RNA helicase
VYLTRALAPFASNNARHRGAQYYDSGAVVHFDPQQSFVYAVVHGTDDYVVRIEASGEEVRGACTCPFFEDRLEICKHFWAVALACDSRGVLQLTDTGASQGALFRPFRLHEGSTTDWDVDDPGDPEFHISPRVVRPEPAPRTPRHRLPPWQETLTAIAVSARRAAGRTEQRPGQILYVVDLNTSRTTQMFAVHLLRQEQKQNGEWGAPKPARIRVDEIARLDDVDRPILDRLRGARPAQTYEWAGAEVTSPLYLRGTVARDLLPVICFTGRCRLALSTHVTDRPQSFPMVPLAWDERVWSFEVQITRDDAAHEYVIDGVLRHQDESVPRSDVQLTTEDGLAIVADRVSVVGPAERIPWLQQLIGKGAIHVPVDHTAQLRQMLLGADASELPGLPEELRTTLVDAVPVPHLTVESQGSGRPASLSLEFSYAGGPPVPAGAVTHVPTRDRSVLARRAIDVERAAEQRLRDLGARASWDQWQRRPVLQLSPADLPRVVRTLLGEGWNVAADGARFRLALDPPELEIRSGIDWFELHGAVRFDTERVALPALLEAIARREGRITLSDGSVGLLPEHWLQPIGALGIGAREGNHLRFTRSQVPLLDALLASRPEVAWDAAATTLRDRIAHVQALPEDPPSHFQGRLRDYQREALGWLRFLRELGFGGCLADDMGLGKTVVVLALLESRRHDAAESGPEHRPSLVVVPRSVLFNWQQEARRFAPDLRVLDLSGVGRRDLMHRIDESDLVLVTYGTLRRDAPALADVPFDYVILDEAQAIKNASTAGAKAARLLSGHHRLALSGTPVENRLADLWSLFEFLNPGLLSGSTAFARSFSSVADSDELQALGRGLRPFILRRTKDQVASELPPRSEQTILCDLDRAQRTLYNELRDHYRRQLLGSRSWELTRIQVLEALLRLRQAACHPGLVDARRAKDPSAKLDLLVPSLIESIEEGHKALVFSQFTSFLALLRTRLDREQMTYEYLDGQTRDRERRVTRFQSEPDCHLFLISLKAGGVGLNLTAADYVFILDPWWNPAAEAQAVDRTHRIGQTRNVFAYRLIARDTVEERVLELQQRKRELADAIITADNSVIRSLQREDLELLLS